MRLMSTKTSIRKEIKNEKLLGIREFPVRKEGN